MATIGTSLVGQMRESDGAPPPMRASCIRNVAWLVDWQPAVSLVGIGVLVRSSQPTRLGDRLKDTRVTSDGTPIRVSDNRSKESSLRRGYREQRKRGVRLSASGF